jgi:hypothetical protein
MAEPRGRAARWSAAALAAPVAAGLFAGTTAWAQRADPLHAAGSATGAASAKPAPKVAAPDPAMVALRLALAANARTVERLTKQVAAVKAQAAALAARGSASSASSRSAYSGSAQSAGSGAGSGGSQKPIVVTMPAPPPPPTQTTTGASGAPK